MVKKVEIGKIYKITYESQEFAIRNCVIKVIRINYATFIGKVLLGNNIGTDVTYFHNWDYRRIEEL